METEKIVYVIRHLMTAEGGVPPKPWVRIGPDGGVPSRYGRTVFVTLADARAAMRFLARHEGTFETDAAAVEAAIPAADRNEDGEFVVTAGEGGEEEHGHVRLDEAGIWFVPPSGAMRFGDVDSARTVAALVTAKTGRSAKAVERTTPRTREPKTDEATGPYGKPGTSPGRDTPGPEREAETVCGTPEDAVATGAMDQ